MQVHSFHKSEKKAQDKELRGLLEIAYRSCFGDSVERIEWVERKAFQTDRGDVCIRLKKPFGSLFDVPIDCFIEEKLRFGDAAEKYCEKDLCLEEYSSKENNTAGCILTSRAHYLCYVWDCRPKPIVAWILPMGPLREWFSLNRHRYFTKPVPNEGYTTIVRLVPVEDHAFSQFLCAHPPFRAQIPANAKARREEDPHQCR